MLHSVGWHIHPVARAFEHPALQELKADAKDDATPSRAGVRPGASNEARASNHVESGVTAECDRRYCDGEKRAYAGVHVGAIVSGKRGRSRVRVQARAANCAVEMAQLSTHG
jgi:hypothetical protein